MVTALTDIANGMWTWRANLGRPIFGLNRIEPMGRYCPPLLTSWEARADAPDCWRLYVDLDAGLPDGPKHVVGEALRLLHAASVDAMLLHALMTPKNQCQRLEECGFCQGDGRPLTVELDISRVGPMRKALFEWEETKASDAYRQTLAAIHRASALLQLDPSAERRPPPLEVVLSLRNLQRSDTIQEHTRKLELLLAQCRDNGASGLFHVSKIVCRGDWNLKMAEYGPILTKLAHAGFPTQFSSCGHDNNWMRKWVRVVIDLLCDPSTCIVGLAIPACGPSREQLERLCSGLIHNTTLKHFALEWDLSPSEKEADHRAEVEMICRTLFSKDTKLRLDFLGLSLPDLAGDDAATLNAFATTDLELEEPRFKCVEWNSRTASTDCLAPMASIFDNCRVRNVELADCKIGKKKDAFGATLALLHGCPSLESISNSYVYCDQLRDEHTLRWPSPQASRLSMLELNVGCDHFHDCDDPRSTIVLMEKLLARVGTNLKTLRLLSSVELDGGVAKSILKYCPGLEHLTVSYAGASFQAELVQAYASWGCGITVLRFLQSEMMEEDPVINMLCDQGHRGALLVRRLEYSSNQGDLPDKRAERAVVDRLLRCNKRLERVIFWANGLTTMRTIPWRSLRHHWAFLSVLVAMPSRGFSTRVFPAEATKLLFAFIDERKPRLVQRGKKFFQIL